jgi:hypothetical protein
VSERYLDETHIVSIRCEVSLYMFGLCMVNRSLFCSIFGWRETR